MQQESFQEALHITAGLIVRGEFKKRGQVLAANLKGGDVVHGDMLKECRPASSRRAARRHMLRLKPRSRAGRKTRSPDLPSVERCDLRVLPQITLLELASWSRLSGIGRRLKINTYRPTKCRHGHSHTPNVEGCH